MCTQTETIIVCPKCDDVKDVIMSPIERCDSEDCEGVSTNFNFVPLNPENCTICGDNITEES
ncbi:hypothetical protein OC861_002053 [Tilletia horrida]|nr:hypothetical protein OC845_001818 [Tilletia horrida]KAK0568342.1 hypothetical protein OC861_002053 [Tilletia horrida]